LVLDEKAYYKERSDYFYYTIKRGRDQMLEGYATREDSSMD
jgi:hypothetical protein